MGLIAESRGLVSTSTVSLFTARQSPHHSAEQVPRNPNIGKGKKSSENGRPETRRDHPNVIFRAPVIRVRRARRARRALWALWALGTREAGDLVARH